MLLVFFLNSDFFLIINTNIVQEYVWEWPTTNESQHYSLQNLLPWICFSQQWIWIWPSNLWICFYQTSYGGYAHHSHGYAPPGHRYRYALTRTSYGGYAQHRHGLDMLLLATGMDRPELPTVDMLLLAMDMLLLTPDRSTMGKDINANTENCPLLLDRGGGGSS